MSHLILVRHGQSEWNLANRFTGWVDVDLTAEGKLEACKAGELIKEQKISIDYFFTSYQKRAIDTLKLILNTLRVKNSSIIKAWELNERHYGSLTGLNKDEMKIKLGEKKVQEFRRSWNIPPEPLNKNNPYHPLNIAIYKNIPIKNIPDTESLKDTYERVLPYFKKEIQKRLEENRSTNFKTVSIELGNLLSENKINAQIFGREKTPFSIWRKVQKKRVSLEQITDIIGFRIILDSIEDCYRALGIFHSKYNCIPGKFKDYISSPKINNYKSIHTAIIGPNKRPIEIQIRTMPMHEFAERGIASHWKYKSSEKFNSLTWKEYDWLKDLVEIIEKNENPEHYFEYTKLQMFQENVFCFTPKGMIIKLPKDATSIDFAYAVHTKIGDAAIGCHINGREDQLQTILKNGDIVEIITSKKVSPSLHWLNVSKTGKARAAIRRYWQTKGNSNTSKTKEYNSALWITLPDIPGKLGEVTTLVGGNNLNISSVEMTERGKDYINFKFNLIIHDLKNFTNLISELKQRNFKFKIIRHENKKTNAFKQKILKYFKKN